MSNPSTNGLQGRDRSGDLPRGRTVARGRAAHACLNDALRFGLRLPA